MRNMSTVTLFCRLSITIAALSLFAAPLETRAEEPIISDDWQFDAQVYIWAADFGGELNNGATFDVPFSTMVDNLKMGFYGSFEARKDKWLVFTDVVYLNIGTDAVTEPPGDFLFDASFRDVKLKGGAINLVGGFNLSAKGRSRIDFIAGVRYLDLGSEFGLNVTRLGETTPVFIPIEMGTAWDVIVGVKGGFAFAHRWSIPYHVDIGAGDSDFTWQVLSGVSYHAAKWVDVALTYRHMEWDLTSVDGVLENVNFSGPSIGATFHF